MSITPDSKDWTWVLQRRCPECGFAAESIEREGVASMLRSNATSWRSVLARDDVASRPAAGDRWSALEYACHVRDVLRLYDERLRLMLETDDPTYPNWDQDATAIESRYGESDPGVVAKEIVAAAEAIAARFESVHGAAWGRSGTRSDGAHFTIETFATYLVHDPIHHLWDVGYSE
jgi:hypothetical protein